jgi:hypothetical protein
MFDNDRSGSIFAAVSPPADVAASPAEPFRVPLERLEAQICELAGPLPEPGGPISQAHDADITPDTIIPPWYGERLDLDHAIWVCFANARTEEQKRADRDQDGDPAARGRVTVYEPEDWPERIRQYEARTPRCFAPVLVPIQV